MQVNWVKSTENKWLPFESFELKNVTDQGVYIIWHTGNPARVVYVGQGDIAERIGAHRTRDDILKYRQYGNLLVTWASVQLSYRDGVERYLADRYRPLVGEAYPDVQPIAVNSP
jgi:hypothetical protein